MAKAGTTTEFARKENTEIEVGNGAAKGKAAADQAQQVEVRALRTFHKEGDMRGDLAKPGDTFQCSRDRAAQLRANGLIEYVKDADEKDIHGEEGARAISERVKRQAEAGGIREKDKGTPLKNPKLPGVDD